MDHGRLSSVVIALEATATLLLSGRLNRGCQALHLHSHDGERHGCELVAELLAELAEDGGLRCELRGLFEGVLVLSIAAEGDDAARGHHVAGTVDGERAAVRLLGAVDDLDDEFAGLLVVACLKEVAGQAGRFGREYLLAVHEEGDELGRDRDFHVVPFAGLHGLRHLSAQHVAGTSAADGLDGRRAVVPAADVHRIAVATALVHAVVDEEALAATRLAGLQLQGVVVAAERGEQRQRELLVAGLGQGIAADGPLAALLLELRRTECRCLAVSCCHLDMAVLALRGVAAQSDGAGSERRGLAGGRCLADEHIIRRAMLGSHLLHVVGGTAVDLGAVDVDEVAGPVAAVLVLEERRIRRHLHHVAVALHAHDEGGLAECGQQIAGSHAAVAGILTDVDVVGAGRIVEQVVVGKEEVGVAVPVGVNHVLAGNLLQEAVGMSEGVDERDLRILSLQSLEDVVEVGDVLRPYVLVAYLDILQREGSGVSGLGAHLGPLVAGWVGQGVVDGIAEVLDDGIHVGIAAHEVAVAHGARHAGVVDEHGIHAEVLAELQELMVAHAPGGAIAPEVPLAAAGHRVAQCLLPLHAVLVCGALDDAAARPAHEPWVQVDEHMRHVGALSVLASLEGGLREKRHVVDEHGARLVEL